MARLPLRMLLLLLAPIALVAPSLAEETIWLRGRGDRAWIEVDGRVRPPQENHKGFTRVATPRPIARSARAPVARVERSYSEEVVLGDPRPYPRYAYPYPYYAYYAPVRYGARYPRAGSRYGYGRGYGYGHARVRRGVVPRRPGVAAYSGSYRRGLPAYRRGVPDSFGRRGVPAYRGSFRRGVPAYQGSFGRGGSYGRGGSFGRGGHGRR